MLSGRHAAHARGRQLERERHSLERPADAHDGARRCAVVISKSGRIAVRALDEEGDGGTTAAASGVSRIRRGHLQRATSNVRSARTRSGERLVTSS